MSAWWLLAVALVASFAVVTVAGRHQLHGWWYSWQYAAHVLDDPQEAHYAQVAGYGSMVLAEERELHHEDWPVFMPAPPAECWPDWREQTAADLAPKALDVDEAIERASESDRLAVALEMGWLPQDPGPGEPSLASTPGPAPVQVAKPAVTALNGAPGYRDEAGRDAGESGHLDRWEWHQGHRPGESLGPRACAVLDRYERRLGARKLAVA